MSEETNAPAVQEDAGMPEICRRHITTLQGGVKYLTVQGRLAWFRHDHPDWTVKTELKMAGQKSIFRSEIIGYIDGAERLIATATAVVGQGEDAMEKAESASIGRALINAGYGIAFASEEEIGYRPHGAPAAPQRGGNAYERGNPQRAPQRAPQRPQGQRPPARPMAEDEAFLDEPPGFDPETIPGVQRGVRPAQASRPAPAQAPRPAPPAEQVVEDIAVKNARFAFYDAVKEAQMDILIDGKPDKIDKAKVRTLLESACGITEWPETVEGWSFALDMFLGDGKPAVASDIFAEDALR